MTVALSPLVRRAPRAHARILLCAFQRRAAYRLANVTGIAVNFFFFLIHAQVFLAFLDGRGRVAGYVAEDAVLYFAASEALMMAIGLMSAAPALQLAERIRSGDIVVDLARPIRMWTRYLTEAYGTGLYYLVARSTVLYVAAVWAFDLTIPLGPRLLWLPLSVGMAIGVSALGGYITAATAYWIESPRGPTSAWLFASLALGGTFVPLDFYPDAIRPLCDLLPFRAMAYTPLALAAGRLSGDPLAFGLLHQLVWTALLCAAAHTIELRGTRRLAAQGG